MSEFVLVEKKDGICKITLNRPERNNAFNGPMLDAFLAALEDAKWDNEVRVVVILGNGKDWQNGMDHADSSLILAAEGDVVPLEIRRPDTEHDRQKWFGISQLRKPIISGIHGEVSGCGVWLVTLSDCVIAGEDTELHNLEYSIGLNYSDPFPLIHSKIPENIAREFAFTGYPITTEVGLRYGLYNHVVPVDKVNSTAMKLAKRMTRLAPYTLTMQKAIADQQSEIRGYSASLPFAMEALNTGLTFVNNPDSDAYWKFAKDHTPDELFHHFHELMDGLRNADDWDLEG